MSGRFDYIKYDDEARDLQAGFKESMVELESKVEFALKPGRAKALVLTKLEEAYMWIGKAIRDDQIEKRKAELQEDRSDE